ncbi:MAG: glycosyltransferase family 2 protein [Terracidiphilus sp.]
MSVVIPTRGRPELLSRALHSVFVQTYSDLEVIVVIDGPDSTTESTLREFEDKRLRVVALSESVGGSEARNVGIRAGLGDWLALLDDDDEWSPDKLAEQMAVADQAGPQTFIACRYIDRSSNAEMVQPAVAPGKNQPISEYLFCEASILGFRKGFLQTSTWVAPRKAFLEVPFTKGLLRNQDTDWLLRAVPALSLDVIVVWKPLSIFHNELRSGRVTGKSDWRYSMDWAIERKELFTKQAFAFFMAIVCAYNARVQGEPIRELFHQLKVARLHGSISPKCLWLFFANWFLFPMGRFGIRTRIQNFFSARVRASSL